MGKLQKTAVAAAVMVAALTVFAGGRALASTLVVSQSEEPCTTGDYYYYSIKTAVDHSYNGDVIEVCDGTYTESFTIYQTELDLESFNLQGATIVAPGYLTPGQAIIEVVNEDFEDTVATPQVSKAVEEDDVIIHGFNITGPAALIHYSIRGGPATDVIDVLVPATPQRHSTGLARLLRTSPLPAGPRGSGTVPTFNSRPHGTQGVG